SFLFSSRRRHTRFSRDWSSDVCSSDLVHGRREATFPLPPSTSHHEPAVHFRSGTSAVHQVKHIVIHAFHHRFTGLVMGAVPTIYHQVPFVYHQAPAVVHQ